jgi:DNA replication protein DnaC
MTAAINARLDLMLTELRLPSIKRLALDLCAQSDREGWPGNRLLEALFEHEMNERDVRRIERHRAESALTADKRLSSFDFSAVPSVSKAQVTALATGTEWLDRGANVLLFGPPGVGKSHLISGLGHALIDAGRRVLFVRCSELVQRLQTARRDLRLAHELAKLDRFDLLVLDSCGAFGNVKSACVIQCRCLRSRLELNITWPRPILTAQPRSRRPLCSSNYSRSTTAAMPRRPMRRSYARLRIG